MFKKAMFGVSALSMVAIPTLADAHHYDNGYEQQQEGYYQPEGYYPQQAYGYEHSYYGRSYGYRRHRCSGTTGMIVGAGAGALLGRSLGRASSYYHQHSGTTGTILGAALGALAGREIGRSTC